MMTRLQDATAGRGHGRDPDMDLAGLVAQIHAAAAAATAIHLTHMRAAPDAPRARIDDPCSPADPKERVRAAGDAFAR